MLYRITKTTYNVVGQKPTMSYTISYIKTYDIEKNLRYRRKNLRYRRFLAVLANRMYDITYYIAYYIVGLTYDIVYDCVKSYDIVDLTLILANRTLLCDLRYPAFLLI